jgi:hypothetical protein
MDLAPVRHPVTTRANALRITRAQKAIAAVMNGVDPDPGDVEATRDYCVDEQLLHLSAAAALRQALMSRPASTAARMCRRGGDQQQLLIDAYYLALALADAVGGDAVALKATLHDGHENWLAPAALLGRLQVRFLEQICAQINMTAGHLPVQPSLATITAREVLVGGGRIGADTVLLDDHSGNGWLHATSKVTVAGIAGTVVVDAGPDLVPASWAARMAAPITVIPGEGRWPVSVVGDVLTLCDDAVRWWVGSMTRELAGDDEEDLLLRIGPPLRQFLISPATATIAAITSTAEPTLIDAVPAQLIGTSAATVPVMSAMPANVDALRPVAPSADYQPRAGTLSAMRSGGEPGAELAPDTVLSDCIDLTDVSRDEMTLLGVVPTSDFASEVEVTVNIATPEWQDVTKLIDEVRAHGAVTLCAPMLARADQDTVTGAEHRLTLRARVRRGVPVHTSDGYAVLLGAGTRLSLLGADVSKRSATLYLQMDDETTGLAELVGQTLDGDCDQRTAPLLAAVS